MAKMKATKLIFGNLSGIKGYKRFEHIYQKYLRALEKKRDKEASRLKEELVAMLPELQTDLKRISRIYGKGAEEMKEDNIIYTQENVQSFLVELENMSNRIDAIARGMA